MPWLDPIFDKLAEQPVCGYERDAAPASEPTALAALALIAGGRPGDARPALDWLARLQAKDGSVGIRQDQSPGWPTSLAVLAWQAAKAGGQYKDSIVRAVGWILAAHGETCPRAPEYGHDTELPGWSYAENTSCWIEPTALHVTALKAVGQSPHARTRDGVRLLIDRLLPGGGCNYGNTVVLGQTLRPHVQPTGIALLALAGETDNSGRLDKSIAWLARSIGPETTTLSLAWALVGLQAHSALPRESDAWLAAAATRANKSGNSPHKLALLALAAKGWPA
jgi:hypothetical protein